MNTSFRVAKKKAKTIRLTGRLVIDVNGTAVEVSNTFKIQTDISYSGMSQAEQDTVLKAVETALAGNADISFTAVMEAEEVKSQSKNPKAPSPLDEILAKVNKPKPEELVAAVVRDDEAKLESITGALESLGVTTLPQTKGVA